MRRLRSFVRDRDGTTGAEFAMVLPVALLFLLGIIDVGYYAWTLNKYEKATQMGARFAVVTDVVASGLVDEDETYVGSTACNGGVALVASQTICKEALDPLICTSAAAECDCTGNCPADLTRDINAFTAIADRMRNFAPDIENGDISVEYRGSGIGFAGDPNKPEIAPIVTVRLNDMTYTPIALSPFGVSVPLPDFRYSLTIEDAEGGEGPHTT